MVSGWVLGDWWKAKGGRHTVRPVLPARAADVIVVVSFVKLMVDSMEKLGGQ